MTKYLLDTNICIFFLQGKYNVPARIKEAELRKQGQLIDDFDILIGVTAVANKMTLVSENLKHLSRIPNIKTENWIMKK